MGRLGIGSLLVVLVGTTTPSLAGSPDGTLTPGSIPERTAFSAFVPGPELPVSDPLIEPSIYGSRSPAVGSNDSVHLLVWAEDRGEYDGLEFRDDRFMLRARVVSRDGQPLSPPFTVTDTPYGKEEPAVAWDGVNFFTTWTDYRGGYGPYIYGARISPTGQVLDSDGIVISARGDAFTTVNDVTWNGANFLVVWTTDYGVFSTRVSSDGSVLDTDPVVIRRTVFPGSVSIAWNGTSHLVTWREAHDEGSEVFARLVTLEGERGPVIKLTEGSEGPYEVASDGFAYVAVSTYDDGNIRAVRVSAVGLVASEPLSFGEGVEPDIVWDGEAFQVVFLRPGPRPLAAGVGGDTDTDVFGARINADATGFIIEPHLVMADAVAYNPDFPHHPVDLGIAGETPLLVWSDPVIHATDLDESGAVGAEDPAALVTTANPQRSLSLATDGTVTLASWADFRSVEVTEIGGLNVDVYVGRIDAEGSSLDGSGSLVATSVGFPNVSVAHADGIFLVVWDDFNAAREERNDIYAARVTPSGEVLDLEGFPVATDPGHKFQGVVASDGTGFLVAWEGSGPAERRGIWAVRVSSLGEVSEPIKVAVTRRQERAPAVAWNDENYVVTWEQEPRRTAQNIYFREISGNGDPIALGRASPVAPDPDHQWNSSLACDQRCLVTWTQRVKGKPAVMGSLLDPAPPPFLISRGRNEHIRASVSSIGDRFLVAWEVREDGYPGPDRSDIEARFIASDGTLSPAQVIASSAAREAEPVLAVGNVSAPAVFYRRIADEDPYGGVYRYFLRFIQE